MAEHMVSVYGHSNADCQKLCNDVDCSDPTELYPSDPAGKQYERALKLL